MDHENLPSTKDVLGEHLFSKVSPLEPTNAEQITGILLGASNDEILLMLENGVYLQSQIEGVKRVLRKRDAEESKSPTGSNVIPRKEEVAEELYLRVSQIIGNNAAKITGMILELGPDPVHHILESPTDLKKAVYKATKALTAGDGRHEEEKSSIAEELFLEVEQRQPEAASEITGMLLEMTACSLQKLLSDPSLLDLKITEAMAALETM